jgi:anti-sigma B factor antagonist
MGVLVVSDDRELAEGEVGSEIAVGGSARQVAIDPAWAVISLPAEIDIANAEQVRADLLAALDRGCPVIIVDMSRTSFCDCAGVRALLAAASRALRDGVEIRVVARARPVLRTFELTGIQLALHVYRTAAEAVRGPPKVVGGLATAGSVLALGTVVRLRHPRLADPG